MRAQRPGIWGADRGMRLAAFGMAALMASLWLTACGGSSAGTSPGASKTAFVQTQTSENYVITLRVTPATFGYNTFSVTLKDAQGAPVDSASVEILTTMLDMDMGVQSIKLNGSSPGMYTGGSELPMAGHWQVSVKVTPSQSTQSFAVDFRFSTTDS